MTPAIMLEAKRPLKEAVVETAIMAATGEIQRGNYGAASRLLDSSEEAMAHAPGPLAYQRAPVRGRPHNYRYPCLRFQYLPGKDVPLLARKGLLPYIW